MKIKLREAIERVTRCQDNEADASFEDEFKELFQVDLDFDSTWWSDAEKRGRLRGYWLEMWNCTDTWVGRSLYFLDGEFVFMHHQTARKSPGCTTFLNRDAFEKVREFIESFRHQPEPKAEEWLDPEAEYEIYETMTYPDAMVRRRAIYQGRVVGVQQINYIDRERLGIPYAWNEKRVWKIEGGAKEMVDISELTFEPFLDGVHYKTEPNPCANSQS